MAAKMGEGVTFVSSRKIKTEQVEGFEATYAFKDITKLRISQKLGTPGPNEPGTAPDDDGEKTMFRFAKLPNGHSLLTTIFPQGKADLGKAPSSPPQESDRKSTRLNSSHLGISYAVFCLKKKKIK